MLRLLISSALLCAFGCGDLDSKPPPPEAERKRPLTQKERREATKAAFPGDTSEKQIVEQIAWKRKATKLLEKMVDEKTSVALIPQLTVLFDEHEQLMARMAAIPLYDNPKERDRLQAKYGKESEAVTKPYVALLQQFDLTTQKQPLAIALEKNHGIDIRRMRMVKKRS